MLNFFQYFILFDIFKHHYVLCFLIGTDIKSPNAKMSNSSNAKKGLEKNFSILHNLILLFSNF